MSDPTPLRLQLPPGLHDLACGCRLSIGSDGLVMALQQCPEHATRLRPGEVSMGPPDAPTPAPWVASPTREGVTVAWTGTIGSPSAPWAPPPAATAERLALAVELDELARPGPWDPPEAREAYVDDVERIASEALGHCQRLEAQLDRLRAAGLVLAEKAEGLVENLASLPPMRTPAERTESFTRMLATLDQRDTSS